MDEKLEEAKQEIEYYKRRFEEQVGLEWDLAKLGEVASRSREHYEYEIWDHYNSESGVNWHVGEEEGQDYKFEGEIGRKYELHSSTRKRA